MSPVPAPTEGIKLFHRYRHSLPVVARIPIEQFSSEPRAVGYGLTRSSGLDREPDFHPKKFDYLSALGVKSIVVGID